MDLRRTSSSESPTAGVEVVRCCWGVVVALMDEVKEPELVSSSVMKDCELFFLRNLLETDDDDCLVLEEETSNSLKESTRWL